MIDYEGLKEKLKNDEDLVYKVLNKLHIEPQDKGTYFAFPNPDGDNAGSNVLYKNTLVYQNYTRDLHGDIITLVMNRRGYNFPKALNKVAEWIGMVCNDVSIVRPFGAFYLNIMANDDDSELFLKTYDESILPPAENFSYKFVKDGISVPTQRKWGVRYDFKEDSILIPIHSLDGSLVGVKARNNDPNCDFSKRWYAYKSYTKTAVVYGLDINYADILKKQSIVIFESEKSVQQADDMNFRCAGALGGHSVSKVQAKIIKSLGLKQIILGFDSDICEEEIQYEAAKLKCSNQFFRNKVGYIWSGLDPKAKLSPTDCGKDVFDDLIRHNVKWLN